MVSAAETMSALGWQGMRNKRLAITAILLAATTIVFAQEETSSESPSKSEVQTENQTSELKTNNTDIERLGIPASESIDGSIPAKATSSTEETEATRPQSAGDDYRPSRRISGDRSVKFPVDI